MFKNQRHSEILDILKHESFASVKDLSDRLYASQPTIRRDLNYLEKQGLVKRSHGGVILADDQINTPLPFRKSKKAKEKIQICKLASSLIAPGSLVFIDASSTAAHLADIISPKDNITVVTNGFPICRTLVEREINLFSTGGRLLKSSMAFVGNQAEATVKRFNADIMFFSASSLSENGVISDYSEEETELRRVMHDGSKTSVFLFDSTKFSKSSAFRLFSLSEIDYIVTDFYLPQQIETDYNFKLKESSDGAYMYQKK